MSDFLAYAAAIVAVPVFYLVGGCLIRFGRDFRRVGAHAIWRRLFWLPEPIYYWLLDRFTDNNGWRPLFYRGRDTSP